jgi:Ran GTPase-activating protein (RanGAP) involved in mRNA processing and transport
MGKKGFNLLLGAMANNPTLQRLDLSNNFIGSFHGHR